MKKIIVFILLIVVCFCTRKTNDANDKAAVQQIDCQSHTERDENGIDIASIDTTEFIVYWDLFRKAVLERDTTTLSTMINDRIYGGFLLHGYKESADKFSKNLFLNNLDSLFIPEFLSLLKSYEIEKYINSNRENILWKKRENKTYRSDMMFASVQMIPNKTTFHTVVYYTMSRKRDKKYYENSVMRPEYLEDDYLFVNQDLERLDYFAYELVFIKKSGSIRLYRVDLVTSRIVG